MNTKQLPSWTVAQLKLSVRINGLFVPFKEAPDSLHRIVRPALFVTSDDIWELQYFGSSTLISYRGHNFAITTKHQTSLGCNLAPDAENYVLVVENEGKFRTLSPTSLNRIRVDQPEHGNVEDLLLFEFSTSATASKVSFLDLSYVSWSGDTAEGLDYSFLIGFPSDSTQIELDDEDFQSLKDFKMRWIRQDLEPSRPMRLDPENRDLFVKHKDSTRISVEPDGLSGCPVFSIVHDASKKRSLKFDGIVTDARGDRFAVYPSQLIRDSLNNLITQRHEDSIR